MATKSFDDLEIVLSRPQSGLDDNFSIRFVKTGLVLDTLSQCSWYNWDYKTKQVLLIFMANSLKPCTFTFAGFQVDKKLAVSIFRIGYTYALVLYNLKK
ncbi:hypothetical protein MTP99_003595 [Tenebrio molitor]|nr:hypothetical protein MTP99_003595 [Tenebrio molitor]